MADQPQGPGPCQVPANSLAPPHNFARFPTFEAAREALDTFTKRQGYALTKYSSIRKGVEFVRYYLHCDRSGTYKGLPEGVTLLRECTTRRINCPFDVCVSYRKVFESWGVTVRNDQHNHPPSPWYTHPTLRRKEFKRHEQEVTAMINSGATARCVLNTLIANDPEASFVRTM